MRWRSAGLFVAVLALVASSARAAGGPDGGTGGLEFTVLAANATGPVGRDSYVTFVFTNRGPSALWLDRQMIAEPPGGRGPGGKWT
jgi:hypothetical protein